MASYTAVRDHCSHGIVNYVRRIVVRRGYTPMIHSSTEGIWSDSSPGGSTRVMCTVTREGGSLPLPRTERAFGSSVGYTVSDE